MGCLPTEPPRIDTRIVPRAGWYKLSLRSLSEITDLTQKLADYSGYDVIYGPNPHFSDLRSLSSEVSLFTSLTSEPFAEGSFVIPACLESDPFTLSEPGQKRQIDTDAVAERFGEILSYVDKDKAPTSVSIGALQTLAALKRTLKREASAIEFSTADRFRKPLIQFSIEKSFIDKVEQALERRRPSQASLETIEGRVTALDVQEGRLLLSVKDLPRRVRGDFSRMLTPSLLESLNRRVKLQGIIERRGNRPHAIHIDYVRCSTPSDLPSSLNSTIPELPGSGWLAAEPEATPQTHRLRPWGFPTVSPSHPSVFPHHAIQRITVEFSENSRFVRRICPSGDILKEGGRLLEIGPRSVFVNLVDGVMH